MKTLLKILLGIVIVAIAVVVLVFYVTGDMVETADGFFLAIKENNIAGAMDHLSEEFRAGTDEAALREFLSRSALMNFKEASWGERHMSGRRGILDGSVITETGGVVPIKLTMVKERDGWKIYALQRPASGLLADGADPLAPRPMEQQMLVQKAMTDFALAIRAGSMTDFHATISRLWQDQYTVAMLDEAYRPVIDAGVDLTVLVQVEPVFDGDPQIDEHGILTLKGHYPSFPSRVFFEQAFIHEGIQWKLVGFSINIE